MEFTLVLVGVALIVGFVIWFGFIRKRSFSWATVPEGSVMTSTKVTQTTPAGVRVFSEFGLPSSSLELIDFGLSDAFFGARASGYAEFLDHKRFEIFIPKLGCERSPVNNTAAFKIRADAYDASEFDQYNPKGEGVKDGIGVILAPEMVLALGTIENQKGQMVCCPDPAELRRFVRYGAEHILIANNDPAYYWATWYHGDGISHPLLPKRDLLAEGHRAVSAFDGAVEAPTEAPPPCPCR